MDSGDKPSTLALFNAKLGRCAIKENDKWANSNLLLLYRTWQNWMDRSTPYSKTRWVRVYLFVPTRNLNPALTPMWICAGLEALSSCLSNRPTMRAGYVCAHLGALYDPLLLSERVVHHYVRSRDLPPEQLHRVPVAPGISRPQSQFHSHRLTSKSS